MKRLHSLLLLLASAWLGACSETSTLKVETHGTIRVGESSQLVIKRTEHGANQTNIAGQDRLQYLLLAPDNAIQIDELAEETNNGCSGNETNLQSGRELTNVYNRSVFFEERATGELVVSIDCYPTLFRLVGLDSTASVQLIVQDVEKIHLKDTVTITVVR